MTPDELSFNPTPERPVTHTEEETQLRLMMFGAALLAIATRENTLTMDNMGIPVQPTAVNEWTNTEARAIAQAVVLEAQRLRAEGKS
jgi:hypothetical protein